MRFRSRGGAAGGEASTTNQYIDRRGRRNLVAGWKEHRVRVGGLSRLQRRRVQQATRRRAEEEQSESEDFHEAVLSALERVHRIQAQSPLCRERRCKLDRFNRSSFGSRYFGSDR